MKTLKTFLLLILTNFLVVIGIGVILAVLSAFGINTVPSSGFVGMAVAASAYGFGGAFVSLALSKFMAKRIYGVKILSYADIPNKMISGTDIVKRSAMAEGLSVPEIGIYESPEPNAFATGMTRNSSMICVSTGLLESMTDREIAGVMGHEFAHIQNGDMIRTTLLAGTVNSFTFFIGFLARMLVQSNVKGDGGRVLGEIVRFVIEIAISFLGMIVLMWHSRKREFSADAGGAKYAGRDNMIAGLERLKSLVARGAELSKASAPAAMGFGSTQSFTALFSSHPPLEDRIAALKSNPFA